MRLAEDVEFFYNLYIDVGKQQGIIPEKYCRKSKEKVDSIENYITTSGSLFGLGVL